MDNNVWSLIWEYLLLLLELSAALHVLIGSKIGSNTILVHNVDNRDNGSRKKYGNFVKRLILLKKEYYTPNVNIRLQSLRKVALV